MGGGGCLVAAFSASRLDQLPCVVQEMGKYISLLRWSSDAKLLKPLLWHTDFREGVGICQGGRGAFHSRDCNWWGQGEGAEEGPDELITVAKYWSQRGRVRECKIDRCIDG